MPLKLVRYPKRGPHWYVRGTVQGKSIFESTGENQKTRAEEYKAKRERELFEQSIYGREKTVTFAQAASDYVNRTGQTRFIHEIASAIGPDTLISNIDQAFVDRLATKLYPGRAPATLVRQVYTPIIAILNDAGSKSVIRKPRIKKKPVKPATDAYISALLPHCNQNLKALVLFLTYTGPRVSEACRITPADFNLRDGWAILGRTKNGEPRMVPLPPEVVVAIANIIPVEGLVFGYSSRWSVNNALRRAARRAGIPYMSSHKVGRHAFAARMLAAGKDIKTVKEAGGWKSIKVLDDNYGHLEQRPIHEAILDAAKTRT